MRRIIDYEKVLVKKNGSWRYIRRAIYKEEGKGGGIEPSKKGSTINLDSDFLGVYNKV